MNDLNVGEVCVRIGYTGKKNKKHLNQYCCLGLSLIHTNEKMSNKNRRNKNLGHKRERFLHRVRV